MGRKVYIGIGAVLVGLWMWWWHSLPDPLFDLPYSTVIEDRSGALLGAQIGTDEQWRFAPSDDAPPDRFVTCLVAYEDKRYYQHHGVDVKAIVRAARDNIKKQRVVSGASTLSMQVIRLSRQGRPRTWREKCIEMLLAVRLECSYSKEDILKLWADHAPFGGNVVGIEAATWRYWGRPPKVLSWAEAATLAILPNAPSLMHPGRDRSRLREKRDRLLHTLMAEGHIDTATMELALLEPLPDAPSPLPRSADHLLHNVAKRGGHGQRARTTIDPGLQERARGIVQRHQRILSENHIYNAAAMIADVATGEVLAYVGNVDVATEHSPDVDLLQARRSSGSILKPFLYAMRMQRGDMLPRTLVPDVPMQYEGFRPSNFSGTFAGAVPADEALAASLNIPAVHQLREVGVHAFHHQLQELGFESINQPADHYGLSLILGGAEVTPWEVAGAYRSLSLSALQLSSDEIPAAPQLHHVLDGTMSGGGPSPYDAGAAYLTLNALRQVKRPSSEAGWQHLSSTQPWAWKTGTSIGHRDAWAAATNPCYVVTVWCGNADGEGRPELTGVKTAAPLLFELLAMLGSCPWYDTPHDALRAVSVCDLSGMKAGPHCTGRSTLIHKHGLRTLPCAYHQEIYTDAVGTHRVHRGCVEGAIHTEVQFELPATMAYYYRQAHPDYRTPLPWHPDCHRSSEAKLAIIYPEADAVLHLPIDHDGTRSSTIFEAVHLDRSSSLHWWLDDDYVGRSDGTHTMKLQPSPGKHHLAIIDDRGQRVERVFEVVQ